MEFEKKQQSKRSEIKNIPVDQKKMVDASKSSQVARNQLHFDESEATRVKGFSKSSDRKNQVQRDEK